MGTDQLCYVRSARIAQLYRVAVEVPMPSGSFGKVFVHKSQELFANICGSLQVERGIEPEDIWVPWFFPFLSRCRFLRVVLQIGAVSTFGQGTFVEWLVLVEHCQVRTSVIQFLLNHRREILGDDVRVVGPFVDVGG